MAEERKYLGENSLPKYTQNILTKIDEVDQNSKMIITVTSTENESGETVYSADKTYSEIKDHIAKGGAAILYDNESSNAVNFSYISDDFVQFSFIMISAPTLSVTYAIVTTPDIIEVVYRIYSDDTFKIQYNQFAVADVEINNLTTEDKTVRGAINEVNAKTVMIVNVTRDTDESGESVYTSDKTYSEIKNHVDNGGTVILRDDTLNVVMNFADIEASGVVFSYIVMYPTYTVTFAAESSTPNIIEYLYYIGSDDTVVFQMNQFAVADVEINTLSTSDKTVAGAINEVNKKSVMLVNVSQASTATDDGSKFSADKTFAEIKAHLDGGGTVILHDDIISATWSLDLADESFIMFSYVTIVDPTHTSTLALVSGTTDIIEYYYMITSDDKISFTYNTISIAGHTIDSLTTENQTVAGAINEINGRVVQSNYEQQDSSQIDYIKNRPFHDAVLETNYVEGDTINIDTDNMYNLVMASGASFYLISSTTPTQEDINKGWSVALHSGVTQTGTECQQVSENLIIFNSVFIVLADNTEFSGVVFPKKGIYTTYGITSITITGFEGFDVYNVIEPIKTLDKKFLPEDYATMDYVNDTFASKGSFLTSLSTLTYRNHVYTHNMSDGSRIFAWILTEKGLWCITSSTIFGTYYERLRINTADYTIESLNRQSGQDVPTFDARLYDTNTGRIINSQSVYNVTKVEIGKFSKISGNNFYIYIDDSIQYVEPIHSFDEIQSDWNQNDETAADYIKNRPCYADESLGTVLFGDTVTFTANGTINYLYEFSSEITLVIGRCYRVIFDEVVYDNLIAYDPWDSGSNIIGNSGYTTEALDSGEYPFQITTQSIRISLNNGDSHSISIVDMSTAYVMLPKEYVSYKPGMVVEKQTFNIDGEEVVAGVCAEIFNNLAENKATGRYSHAEGAGTTASGDQSHAEGSGTTASGYFSHAEGRDTTASNHGSHAEGYSTIASNYCSHAEGCLTTASGEYSHAEGEYTIASGVRQHVQGKYNIEDTENKYAHIVGNGTYSARSNAHTLDWSGNGWFAGDVYVGGTSQDDASKLLTEADIEYVTEDEITEMLTELGLIESVATDENGDVLTDEDGDILTA